MHKHTLTQVGNQSLWPVPAESMIVVFPYTELVCVVITDLYKKTNKQNKNSNTSNKQKKMTAF